MQLDKLQISTRPKSSWQCFDLGCRVAIKHYKALFSFWIVASLPIFVLCIVMSPAYGFLVFWLLKPLFERGLLYYLSRVVFGETLSVKETLSAWPSQMKPMWLSSITIRRLAPSRSFNTAVTQLEGLTGEQRTKRLTALHHNQNNNTPWWTVCCAHWEAFIQIGLLTLMQIMLPTEFGVGSFADIYMSDIWEMDTILNIVLYLSASLIAPFYVAGGFIAYLNRRVILEGWDIELGFKRWTKNFIEKQQNAWQADTSQNDITEDFAQNNAGSSDSPEKNDASKLQSILLCLGLLFSLQVLVADPVFAQNNDNTEDRQTTPDAVIEDVAISEEEKRKQAIRQDLNNVYSEAPLRSTKTETRYRLKDQDEDEKEDVKKNVLPFMVVIAKWISNSVELILWVAFIAIMGVIIYINRNMLSGFFSGPTGPHIDDIDMPSFLGATYQEKLPNDILTAVRLSIGDEDFRKALSLLVRASLTELSQTQKLHITKSMTENECLQLVKANCEIAVYQNMRSLLQVWMSMAWAHRLPTSEVLYGLCAAYEDVFVRGQVNAGSEQDANKKHGNKL